MPITKNIIITIGQWGVGKTHYADKFVAEHPEYVSLNWMANVDLFIDKIRTNEYIITEYCFENDWNAEQLKRQFECPVEIIVIFDSPESISYRQIFKKYATVDCPVDCESILSVYENELRTLIYMPDCKYVDGDGNQYDYEGFKEKLCSYRQPYTKEMIEKYVKEISAIDGYSYAYQEFDLPYGISIGTDGYPRNKQTWKIIESWIDWRGKRTLELCCNHAWLSQQIWLRGGDPVGCDIHQNAIYSASVFAKMNGIKIKLYHCDIEKEIPRGYHDVLFLFNAFHHLKNKDDILSRMRDFPTCLFEINAENRTYIEKYFTITREQESPKDGRVILMCKPKGA